MVYKWKATKVYSFVPFWDSIHHWKTKNTAKNQNFCKNCILWNIKQRKTQVPEKSQNSCKIKQKINIFWAQTGSKLSSVVAPKDYQKFSDGLQQEHSFKRSGCQVSVSVYFLFSTLPGRSTTFFLVQDPIVVGLGAITPVNNIIWN